MTVEDALSPEKHSTSLGPETDVDSTADPKSDRPEHIDTRSKVVLFGMCSVLAFAGIIVSPILGFVLLPPPAVSDVDGNEEGRRGAVSVFNGPDPTVNVYETEAEEVDAVAAWLRERVADGIQPHAIAVIVRSEAQLSRARASIGAAGMKILKKRGAVTEPGCVAICTMHLAKGLEFRAVVVPACDDEVIPLQTRVESIADEADLEEIYNTERHLLYVACTRARDHLLVAGAKPGSEFLDDLHERLRE